MNLLRRKICYGLTVPLLMLLFVLNNSVVLAQFQRTPLGAASEPTPAKAQAAPQTSAAEQAIKNMAVAFKGAFDRGDAKKVASFWAPEGGVHRSQRYATGGKTSH